MRDTALEARVLRFEQAWLVHGPCEIAHSLSDLAGPASPERSRLLVELICIDMEFRWRKLHAAEPVSLECYVAQFPELISLDQLPLELIGEEYRVRRRWGDRPTHAEFLSRFHERRAAIEANLLLIDDELAEESSEPRQASRSAASAGLPAVDLEGPLLSHRDYLLRRLIGAGRMGKVYEARQHDAGRDVAVKFLRKTLLRHPAIVRRFIGEARTIAKLCHPHIVGTQGLGRTPGGSYFLVMELVTGSNLALLASRRVVTVDEAIGWAMEACEALEHAHQRGIVHCDLKPANLLRDERGTIKVADFGLARSLVEDTPWTAEVEGTVPFMAPEQACRSWGQIDPRTDVYGIGAVLFALLTGRPRFVGRRVPDILTEVASAIPVVSPARLRPGLPEPLSEVCRTCLAKAPEARFPTIREVRRALAEIRKSDFLLPKGGPHRPPPW